MAQGPENLYRYRHLQGNHREYTRRILTDSVLYFASPSSFNDPFDCKVHFEQIPQEELRKKYNEMLINKMPGLNRRERREKVRSDTKRVPPKKFSETMRRSLQNEVDNLGILSLSATDKNILLWSHYGAGHTGLCLRFSRKKPQAFIMRALQVKYSSEYPVVHLFSPGDWERIEALLLTKASNWRYEEEWRIIDEKKGPGEQRFPEDLLTGVILGARMPQKDRDEVLEWLKVRKSPVDVYEARVSSTSFSLEIVPYG